MTNRGLFALLASTSVGIDIVTTLLRNQSSNTLMFAAIYFAITAIAIFCAFRGFKVAAIILAVWCGLSIISTVSDFFPLSSGMSAVKPADFVIDGFLAVALALYFKRENVLAERAF